MSRLLALALVICVVNPAFGQEDPTLKYWVFFDQKPVRAAKAVAIAPEAADRRARKATRIPVDLDYPVSETYVAKVASTGAQPVVRSRWFNAVSIFATAEQLAEVERMPFVRGTQPVGVSNGPSTQPGIAAPTFGPVQTPGAAALRLDYGASFTQLSVVNAIEPLEDGINGEGVILGIIDTGAGVITHPSLTHIVDSGRLLGQENFTGQGDDGHRHARQVLSVAAGFDEGNLIGPAHAAQILLARTEYTPTETNQEEDFFVAGMEWLESRGADVVNCSLGYSLFDDGQVNYTTDDLDGDTAITTRAADLAASLGVIFVTSAGNEGTAPWQKITTPADGDSVIAVGAVDDLGLVAAFSGRGPTADGRTKPDVSAMGQGVTVAIASGYTSGGNGTSFSSPMVAGIVAQMVQVNPDLGPMDALDILRNHANKSDNPDNNVGWGVVDAAAAIAAAAALNTSSESPLPDRPFIAAAYPNPAAGRATLEVTLPAPHAISVRVFDVLGREVGFAQFDHRAAGTHLVELPLPAGAAGWFGFRVQAGWYAETGSLTMVR